MGVWRNLRNEIIHHWAHYIQQPEKAGRPRATPAGSPHRGAAVEDISVYRTVPVAIESPQLDTLASGVDALSFTSGSTARCFVEAWCESGRDAAAFDKTPVFCIGPVTEKVVRDLGFQTRIVADEYTTEGLVSAMVRHFSKEQQ